MGMLHAQKGMLWWTICMILPVISTATLCPPGRQYWDEKLEKCLDCRNCSTVHGEVVLRPCQVHQDTQCGPLSALQIDWSFLRPNAPKKMESSAFTESDQMEEKTVHHHNSKKQKSSKSRKKPKHHHHHHHNHHHQSEFLQMESLEESSHSMGSSEDVRTSRRHQSKMMRWDSRNSSSSSHHSVQHKHHNFEHHHHNGSVRSRIHHSKEHNFLNGKTLPQSASQVKIVEEPLPLSSGLVATSTLSVLLQPPSSPAPFSTAEEIVWDWQAIALALAVFACILFFLVAGAYSVHHARQWRRLRDNFEADVEELSTTLSLMVPGSQPDTNQCIYMEQLLVRKQQVEADDGEQGNVYIDRDKDHKHHMCN